MFTVVRYVADAPDLTTGDTFAAAVGGAAPILLAGLGGLYSERAGVVNIGLEGMMTLGTWAAGWAGWHYGPYAALVAGALGGALGGLVHALATVTFGVDHIVSGVAINVAAPGITRFLASEVFVGKGDGSISNSPTMNGTMGRVSLPFVSGGSLFGWKTPDPSGWLDKKRWFLVSDIAGVIHGFTSRMAWSTVLTVLLLPFTAYLLWRTRFGLRLRSVGEKPSAADSLGVNVYRMKYYAVLDLRCAGRSRRRMARRRRAPLQRTADRRARLPGPGRHDLRQLPAVRTRRRSRPLLVHAGTHAACGNQPRSRSHLGVRSRVRDVRGGAVRPEEARQRKRLHLSCLFRIP